MRRGFERARPTALAFAILAIRGTRSIIYRRTRRSVPSLDERNDLVFVVRPSRIDEPCSEKSEQPRVLNSVRTNRVEKYFLRWMETSTNGILSAPSYCPKVSCSLSFALRRLCLSALGKRPLARNERLCAFRGRIGRESLEILVRAKMEIFTVERLSKVCIILRNVYTQKSRTITSCTFLPKIYFRYPRFCARRSTRDKLTHKKELLNHPNFYQPP